MRGTHGLIDMIRIDESTKNILAMLVGAITSVGASFTNAIKGYSLKAIASVPFMSFEYMEMLATALLVGMAGATGGLIVREAFKLVCKKFFPEYYKSHKDD